MLQVKSIMQRPAAAPPGLPPAPAQTTAPPSAPAAAPRPAPTPAPSPVSGQAGAFRAADSPRARAGYPNSPRPQAGHPSGHRGSPKPPLLNHRAPPYRPQRLEVLEACMVQTSQITSHQAQRIEMLEHQVIALSSHLHDALDIIHNRLEHTGAHLRHLQGQVEEICVSMPAGVWCAHDQGDDPAPLHDMRRPQDKPVQEAEPRAPKPVAASEYRENP
jgi:hypothetical protein